MSEPSTARKIFTAAALIGLVAALITVMRTIRQGSATLDDTVAPPRAPDRVSTAATTTASTDPPAASWVEPGPDGETPSSHPVKLKLSSGIFHVPGGGSYDRTAPDRCYQSAEAAEADGFRQAKR